MLAARCPEVDDTRELGRIDPGDRLLLQLDAHVAEAERGHGVELGQATQALGDLG